MFSNRRVAPGGICRSGACFPLSSAHVFIVGSWSSPLPVNRSRSVVRVVVAGGTNHKSARRGSCHSATPTSLPTEEAFGTAASSYWIRWGRAGADSSGAPRCSSKVRPDPVAPRFKVAIFQFGLEEPLSGLGEKRGRLRRLPALLVENATDFLRFP